ncbi:hypothetical protein CN553_28520 [Bacillus cereus]|uniref:Tc1-like transposase DDE domain-containing protein n=1 Tax=Bacillus cereus TaxID=1396 RepID=A0A9X6U6E9_BACCE|nr:hypothetical protein CN553_28520 [Bacillus cereus]
MPPTSPNLNVLERIWKLFKESMIAHRFHLSKKDLKYFILSFLIIFPRLQKQRFKD